MNTKKHIPIRMNDASEKFFQYFLLREFPSPKNIPEYRRVFNEVMYPKLGMSRKFIVGVMNKKHFKIIDAIGKEMFAAFPGTYATLCPKDGELSGNVLIHSDDDHRNMKSNNIVAVPRWAAKQFVTPFIFGTNATDRRMAKARVYKGEGGWHVYMGWGIRAFKDDVADFIRWPSVGLVKDGIVPVYKTRRKAVEAYLSSIRDYLRMLVRKRAAKGCSAVIRKGKLKTMVYYTFSLKLLDINKNGRPKFKLVSTEHDVVVDMTCGFRDDINSINA